MALWQFVSIAVLIGALLVYAGILTSRIGRTNAALKRIEEALVVRNVHVMPATGAPEAMPALDASSRSDAARYLTIRDLKGRSEILNSRATRSVRTASDPENEVAVATNPGSRDAVDTSGELPSSHATRSESGEPVAASSQNSDALNTDGELPSSSATLRVTDDSVAKKERDALLFLMNQRRRRRARQGY